MFSIFKNQFIDETLEEQLADIEKYPPEIKSLIFQGVSCDKVPNGTGDFGTSATNPIPVNGIQGQIKYINRLRSTEGCGYIYHRLCSLKQKGTNLNIDAYELVSLDSRSWDVLYFDMYHPRRSTMAPSGYAFSKFDTMLSKLPVGFGVNELDTDFPFTIPNLMKTKYGTIGEALAKKLTTILHTCKFDPPLTHKYKVMIILGRAFTIPPANYDYKTVQKSIYIFTTKDEQVDLLTAGVTMYRNENLAQVEDFLSKDFVSYLTDESVVNGKIKIHFDNIKDRINQYSIDKARFDALYERSIS